MGTRKVKMSTITSIVSIACFVSVGIAIADMIKPSDKFDKQLKTVFAIILALAVVIPFTKAEFSLGFSADTDIKPQSDFYSTRILQVQTEQNIERELKIMLAANDIDVKNIFVTTNIEDNLSISIIKVEIYTGSSEDNQKSKELIATQLNISEDLITTTKNGD
jgi:hypothetical protein